MLLAIYVRTKITSKLQEQLNFISENLVVVVVFWQQFASKLGMMVDF